MEALIFEVQRRNVLWNKRNPRYKDRLIVDREWDAVAHNTGFSKEDAKKKWRNLRDQFAKELKKVRKPHSGDSADDDGGQYTGRWQYFVSLEFLRGIVAPRSTEGNVFHIEVLEERDSPVDNTDDEKDSEQNSANIDNLLQMSDTTDASQATTSEGVSQLNTNYISQASGDEGVPQKSVRDDGVQEANGGVASKKERKSSESTNMSSNITPPLKRKRVREENMNVEEKLLDIETRKIALLETPEDENSLFLRSLLPYLQKMTPLQQLRVRNKFQEILIQEMTPQRNIFHPSNAVYVSVPSTSVSSESSYSNIVSPIPAAVQPPNMYPDYELSEMRYTYLT